MSPTGEEHGEIAGNIAGPIWSYVRGKGTRLLWDELGRRIVTVFGPDRVARVLTE